MGNKIAIKLYMLSTLVNNRVFCDVNIGFTIKVRAYTGKGEGEERSVRNQVSHVISAMTRLIDQYSTSTDDQYTEVCFLDLQDTGKPPSVMK